MMLLVVILFNFYTAIFAANFDDVLEKQLKSLNYEQGKIKLQDDIATIDTNKFYFLNQESTRMVLTDVWGNPPQVADGVLGMIVPKTISLGESTWGVIISYEDKGYVSDDDADNMDYDKLFTEMQEASAATNEKRKENGYPEVQLVAWAEKPHYDRNNHKLYWAKELSFSDQRQHTLNYSVRILGRRGVLQLNAITDIDELENIKPVMDEILINTNFNQGHRYIDFDPKLDKVAGYGIAALIAGVAATKLGLFAKIGAILFAFKKLIIAGIVGFFALISSIFGKKSKRSE